MRILKMVAQAKGYVACRLVWLVRATGLFKGAGDFRLPFRICYVPGHDLVSWRILKVGSTTIMNRLYNIAHTLPMEDISENATRRNYFMNVESEGISRIQEAMHNGENNTPEDVKSSASLFMFLVVREPWERFISGYNQGLVFPDCGRHAALLNGKRVIDYSFVFRVFIYVYLGIKSKIKIWFSPDLEFYAKNLPSYLSKESGNDIFIKHCGNYADHFQDELSWSALCLMRQRQLIYPMETDLERLSMDIQAHTGVDPEIRYQKDDHKISLHRLNVTSRDYKKIFTSLSAQAQQNIARHLASDYEFLQDYYVMPAYISKVMD